jgi:hypothetical protein
MWERRAACQEHGDGSRFYWIITYRITFLAHPNADDCGRNPRKPLSLASCNNMGKQGVQIVTKPSCTSPCSFSSKQGGSLWGFAIALRQALWLDEQLEGAAAPAVVALQTPRCLHLVDLTWALDLDRVGR